MILLVGLGNPGPRYADTRHNVGFRVVEQVVDKHGGASWRSKFDAEVTEFTVAQERVCVVKPQTFMNLSGHSVRAALAFYKLSPEQLLVVHDELDLAFGDVRLKLGGGEAGHNGLKSITEQLGSSAYARLRFGIGRPPAEFRGAVADYVLEAWPPPDQPPLDALVKQAQTVVDEVICRGIAAVMNQVNRRKK